MLSNKLIYVDGCDSSGKSTQIELLKEHFESKNKKVLVTREIGSTLNPITIKLRDILLNSNYKISDKSLQIIHSAQAKIHREEVIEKYLSTDEYDIILCDRSPLSYYSYGNAMVNDMDWLIQTYKLNAENNTLYGTLIYLEIDSSIANDRLGRRPPEKFENEGVDSIEAMGIEFQKKVKQNFNYVLDNIVNFFDYIDKSKIHRIDVNNKTISETHKDILSIADKINI